MYIWGMSGRGSGRVRIFVSNRGSGQRFSGSGQKSDPWTTLGQGQGLELQKGQGLELQGHGQRLELQGHGQGHDILSRQRTRNLVLKDFKDKIVNI